MNRRSSIVSRIGTCLLGFALAGCVKETPPAPVVIGGNGTPVKADPCLDSIRYAKVGLTPPGGRREEKIVYLEQGWSPALSQNFYFTSQGSQIIPYLWFLNLPQAGSDKLFRDEENLLGYGYLIQEPGPMNPDGLPVGFVRDEGDKRDWLGFTCAACHTSQIDLKGVGYRIDGGAALADVQRFLTEMAAALKATREDGKKFDAFAKGVLGPGDSPAERERLKADLKVEFDRRNGYNQRNFPDGTPALPARVDAFGAITNEVFHEAARTQAQTPAKENAEPADAPVSYPFLWDTPQHDVVQWNGVAKNGGLGSLGRNVGEVLGVFGRLEIGAPHPSPLGYQSSVRIRNLNRLEDWLKELWSPQWPDAFGPIDTALRDQGKQVYARLKCFSCHDTEGFERTSASRKIVAKLVAVGTDARMAVNFAKRYSLTGKLEGTYVKLFPPPIGVSKRFGPKGSAEDVLSQVVMGTITSSGMPAPEDQLLTIDYKRQKSPTTGLQDVPTGTGGVYKARQLNGIWATAPYLHNGSIPTLDDLFKPEKDRPKSFTVGSREFDPVRVGFKTDAAGYPVFRARNDDGTPVAGNSNEGHNFFKPSKPEVEEQERRALVEYLKSL